MIMQGILLFIILLVAIMGIYIYLKSHSDSSSQEHLTSPHMTVGKYLSLRYRGDTRSTQSTHPTKTYKGWSFTKRGKHIYVTPPPHQQQRPHHYPPSSSSGSGTTVSTTRGRRKPVSSSTDPIPTQTQSPQTGQISDLPILNLTVEGNAQPYINTSRIVLSLNQSQSSPIQIQAAFDTGSSILLAISQDCPSCKASTPNSTQSSGPSGGCNKCTSSSKCDCTYGVVPSVASLSNTSNPCGGTTKHQCPSYGSMKVSQGIDWATSLNAQNYNKSIPLSLTLVQDVESAQGNKIQPNLNMNICGMIDAPGVSGGNQSFLSQMFKAFPKATKSFVVDYSQTSDRNLKATVTFGAIDTSSSAVSVPLLPSSVIRQSYPYYIVPIAQVYYVTSSGKQVPISTSLKYGIIDTGTTFTAGPTADINSITSTIKANGAGTIYFQLGTQPSSTQPSSTQDQTSSGPSLYMNVPSSFINSHLGTLFQQMNSFPNTMLIGINAMLGNVMTFNMEDKYLSVRAV